MEWELPLVLSSVLGAWRLEAGLGYLGEAFLRTPPALLHGAECLVGHQHPIPSGCLMDHSATPHFTEETEAREVRRLPWSQGWSAEGQGPSASCGLPRPTLSLPEPRGTPAPPRPGPPGAHSLQRLTMAVFFLAFSVLLADSEGGSSSQDRL